MARKVPLHIGNPKLHDRSELLILAFATKSTSVSIQSNSSCFHLYLSTARIPSSSSLSRPYPAAWERCFSCTTTGHQLSHCRRTRPHIRHTRAANCETHLPGQTILAFYRAARCVARTRPRGSDASLRGRQRLLLEHHKKNIHTQIICFHTRSHYMTSVSSNQAHVR